MVRIGSVVLLASGTLFQRVRERRSGPGEIAAPRAMVMPVED
jgi:hypothetical protein